MSTIADQLVNISTTKSLIRDAIIAQGVAVPDTTPFRQFADKISEIEGGTGGTSGETAEEWTRPLDRPGIPVLANNEIYMLFGVTPTGPNDFAITLSGATYYADWGDGTIDTVSSGVKAEHKYNYDSLAIAPNDDGIKWVWIKFYISTGNFTTANINVRHSARPGASSTSIFVPQVYEIYIRATNLSTLNFALSMYTMYKMLEIFKYFGTNAFTSFYYFMNECRNLKLFEMDTSLGLNFSNFMYNCNGFNNKLNIDTSNASYLDYFMNNCSSFNQPLNIDTSKVTIFSNFMVNCYSFNQPLTLDMGSVTNITAFLNNCYSFNKPLNLLNLSSVTNMTSFLQNCYSFNQPLNLDTSNVTQFGSFLVSCYTFNQPLTLNTSKGASFLNFINGAGSFSHKLIIDLTSATTAVGTGFISTGCKALTGLRLLNMGGVHGTITISNSNLTASSLEELFNDLYDRTGSTVGGITITGVTGASALTAEQRAIATGKNWTITG